MAFNLCSATYFQKAKKSKPLAVVIFAIQTFTPYWHRIKNHSDKLSRSIRGEVLEASDFTYECQKNFFQSLSKWFSEADKDKNSHGGLWKWVWWLAKAVPAWRKWDSKPGSELASPLACNTCTGYKPSSEEDGHYLSTLWIKIQRWRSYMSCWGSQHRETALLWEQMAKPHALKPAVTHSENPDLRKTEVFCCNLIQRPW